MPLVDGFELCRRALAWELAICLANFYPGEGGGLAGIC